MIKEVRHAYSIFGLAPGVSAPVIRQRCRIMLNDLRRHPAGEQRQAEILAAYRTIRRHYGQIRKRVSESPSSALAQRPLTQEEIAAFSDGVGNENLLEPFLWPFRWLADLLGWLGMFGLALNVLGLAGLLLYALVSSQPGLFFRNEDAVIVAVSFLAVGSWLLIKRLWTRTRSAAGNAQLWQP